MLVVKFWSKFVDRFQQKHTTTWAASLAFYTSLSLAPLLMLFLIVSSQLNRNLQDNFIAQVRSLMGQQGAEAIQLIIDNAKSRPDLMSLSGMVGAVTLLISASLIFGELRAALNHIFEKPEVKDDYSFFQSIWQFFKVRILQMGLVLGFLFIMIVSLGVSAIVSATLGEGQGPIGVILNIVVSGGLYIFLFTLLFHYLPEDRVSWKRSVQGATITAILFVIGKEIIGIYLGQSALSSSYGAAGSVLVLLGWVYYSTLIIFVGAHASYLLHAHQIARLRRIPHEPHYV